jgi:hypothetical protein
MDALLSRTAFLHPLDRHAAMPKHRRHLYFRGGGQGPCRAPIVNPVYLSTFNALLVSDTRLPSFSGPRKGRCGGTSGCPAVSAGEKGRCEYHLIEYF